MKNLGIVLLCTLLVLIGVACKSDHATSHATSQARDGGEPDAAADGGANGGQKKFEFPGGPCHPFGPSRAELGSKLELILSSPTVDYMVSTATGLYFSGRDTSGGSAGIYRLAPGATAPKLVAAGAQPSSALVAGAGRLAWAGNYNDQPGVWTMPEGVDSTTPVKALDDPDSKVWEVAVDADHAYAWSFFERTISCAPLTGGAAETLGSGSGVVGLVVDGGFLYVGAGSTSVFSGDSIWRMPVAGGAQEGVVTAPDYISRFVLDATSLYFAGDSAIYGQKRSDPKSQRSLLQHPQEVSSSPTVAVSQLVLHDTTLFYVDNLQNVGWVRTDGSNCGFVVAAFTGSSSLGVAISADTDYVYLSDRDARTFYRVKRSAL